MELLTAVLGIVSRRRAGVGRGLGALGAVSLLSRVEAARGRGGWSLVLAPLING